MKRAVAAPCALKERGWTETGSGATRLTTRPAKWDDLQPDAGIPSLLSPFPMAGMSASRARGW
ncbi:hypothetical protein GCM10023334_125250 [Nonomuraea thailandensis]